MKKYIVKILLILGYCIPFVFLAMNEDAIAGTLWFYLIMIAGFGVLCFISIKTKNAWIVVAGNILSFVTSCIFAWHFQTEKWEYYFKPFLPNQLIVFESLLVLLIQIIFVVHHKKGEVEMRIIRKCNHCKRWFAMKMQEKTLVQKDEIKILERLYKHNLKGGLETALNRFVPGERLYYNIRHVCKYCGAEENEYTYEDVKK